MKANLTDNEFKPVELTIVLETQEEAELYYALFDNEHICEAFGYSNSLTLRHNVAEYYDWEVKEGLEARLMESVKNKLYKS